MAGVKELLATFAEVAQNPSAQADAYIAQGRRIIGVGPYYVPEERVDAGGGVPIVAIEIDQSTETYGQARTQLETFVELIG